MTVISNRMHVRASLIRINYVRYDYEHAQYGYCIFFFSSGTLEPIVFPRGTCRGACDKQKKKNNDDNSCVNKG
jgi:hypothetical protein